MRGDCRGLTLVLLLVGHHDSPLAPAFLGQLVEVARLEGGRGGLRDHLGRAHDHGVLYVVNSTVLGPDIVEIPEEEV